MQQLSGLDTFFLNLETNTVPMHVGCLTILDPDRAKQPLSFESARRHIESRLHLMPALRRRLLRAPLNLDMPYWIEDPDFDIEQHVRRRWLPQPGGEAELDALVCESLSTRLDRTRPLWEVLYIEGLQDGRVALFSKVHHSCVDGVSGADLISQLLDTSAEGRKVSELPDVPWEPAPTPTPIELARTTARSLISRPHESLRLFRQSLPLLVTAGRAALARQHASRKSTDDGGSGLSLAPRTPFNTAIDARRSFATASLPMSRLKSIKNSLKCTLNDLVLAVSAQALRTYLIGRKQLPARPLIAGVPVSMRSKSQRGGTGNRIKFVRIPLATNLDDPMRRLRHVQSAMLDVKHDEPGGPRNNLLGEWAEVPAPAIMVEAARLYENFCVTDYFSPPFNLIISNVPGSRRSLYFNGTRVIANYPASIPYHGLGFNITVFSDQGNLNIGVTAHRGTVPDTDHFMMLWEESLAVYEALAASPIASGQSDEGDDVDLGDRGSRRSAGATAV